MKKILLIFTFIFILSFFIVDAQISSQTPASAVRTPSTNYGQYNTPGYSSTSGYYGYGNYRGFGGFGGGASYVNRQYNQPGLESIYSAADRRNYWPILEDDPSKCEGRQDLIMQVAPAGCQPAVVRSDLLAEQNVPVFCQIDSYKLNPLINIQEIRNIRFRQFNSSDQVAGIGFHPARAALRSYDRLLGSPLINNIGYVVVLLKRQEVEKNIPENIVVNLGAQVDYDSGNALGVGRAEFILTPLSDSDWEKEKVKQSFWQGRYFVRLEEVNSEFAIVSVYYGDRKIRTTKVDLGKTSDEFYVPGGYCRAGLQVSFDGFIAPWAKARLEISDEQGTDVIDVYDGSRFLNDKCRVNRIFPFGRDSGIVQIDCGGREKIELRLARKDIPKESSDTASTSSSPAAEKKPAADKSHSQEIERNFAEAIKNYELIANEYSEENYIPDDERESAEKTGQVALYRAIELSRQLEKSLEEERLIKKYISKYKDDKNLNARLNELYELDSSLSGLNINLDNGVKYLRLVQISNYESYGVGGEFTLGDDKKKASVGLGQERGFTGKNTVIRLDRIIDDKSAEISVFCDGGRLSEVDRNRFLQGSYFREYGFDQEADYRRREESGTRVILRVGEKGRDVCGDGEIKLNSVNGELFARIRLIPQVRGTQTETNLTVSIGIEKRAIKLSPEKTEELVENLNETIERWTNINEKLGSFVSGLKGACFATAAVLTAKNFFAGLSGESLAREKVIQGDGGWAERCQDAFSSGIPINPEHGQYSSVDDCFRKNRDVIESSVDRLTSVIDNYDKQIEDYEKQKCVLSDPTFGERILDTNCSAVYLTKDYKSYVNDKNVEFNARGKTYNIGAFSNSLSENSWDRGDISVDELRDLKVYNQILADPNANEIEKETARLRIANIIDNTQLRIESSNRESRVQTILGNSFEIDEYETAESTKAVYRGGKLSADKIRGIDSSDVGKSFEVIRHNNKLYGVVLDGRGDQFTPSKVYELRETDGNLFAFDKDSVLAEKSGPENEGIRTTINNEFTSVDRFKFQKFDGASYRNRYLDPKVRFYESGQDAGTPAVVPFDVANGWYAGTQQVLPVFGQRSSFTSGGQVQRFWLCNVGINQREEFSKSDFGDDTCQQFDFNTGQVFNKFPGLDESETRRLVQRAQRALQDSARQYGSGLRNVRIEGQSFNVGDPAVAVPKTRCQDFMDPSDCQIMFNVCDPVICPASRCNLGGKFQVADVVQSGIVGSALLCLPNFREGILVPVCLTGIHAGIESYLSILRAHQSCLQESLDTGRTVGICDQITSVYLCEFFWRQIAPAAKVILPKLIESAYGQGTRGGGEYLTVMSAWQNAQRSVEYFTQEYAVNALNAYKVRSIGEVGTQFCKAFVSAKGPNSFESLVQPDSPVQFHAWFDSVPFSDATVPPTAQYKVYYHIFAGNDQGIQFNVYLRSPTETTVFTNPQVVVASGFIPRGEFATESKDFTAPAGYKELCVNVNGKEECGFQQVSTSFALNSIRDNYVADEITRQNINSERDCISGGGASIRAGSLINPNIQAGVEDALLPEIYNRGIVRICSTDNPGRSTEPGRFVEVGNCGAERIKCWLDKRSVDNSISDQNRYLENQTLIELNEIQKDLLKERGGLIGAEADNRVNSFKTMLNALKKRIRENAIPNEEVIKFNSEIDSVLEEIVFNNHRVQLILLKGELYESITLKLLGINDVGASRSASRPSSSRDTTAGSTEPITYTLSAEFNEINSNVNVIEKRGSQERILLSIKNRLVYYKQTTVLLGTVRPKTDGNFEIDLSDTATLRNRLESEGITNPEELEQYLSFDGAIIQKGTRSIRILSSGEAVSTR